MSMELYSNHQETNPAGGQSDQDSNPSPPYYVSRKLKPRPQSILVNGRLYSFAFSPGGQSDQDSNPSPPYYVSRKLKPRPQSILVNGRLYSFAFSPVGIYGGTTLGKSTS